MSDNEPDYLDEMVRVSIEDDPRYAESWEPYAHMIALAKERTRLGLSIADVASRMGVSRAVVARMETSPENVAFSRILRYAHSIGMEVVIQPNSGKIKQAA